jgi:hypothetical protein
MTDYYSEIADLDDGTYIIKQDGTIENYGDKWAYGYVVGLRALTADDLHPGRLFGVWTCPEDGTRYLDVVEHVTGRENALALGYLKRQKAIYDLRAGGVVNL